MVLIKFDLEQDFNLKDLEDISLLYNSDISLDFKDFINFLDKDIIYPYLKSHNNYLIKTNIYLLMKNEEDMIQQEKDIKNILLSFDYNLVQLDNFKKAMNNFNGNLKELINFPVELTPIIDSFGDEDGTKQKIDFLKNKMSDFLPYEKFFSKKDIIYDDIICISEKVVI